MIPEMQGRIKELEKQVGDLQQTFENQRQDLSELREQLQLERPSSRTEMESYTLGKGDCSTIRTF